MPLLHRRSRSSARSPTPTSSPSTTLHTHPAGTVNGRRSVDGGAPTLPPISSSTGYSHRFSKYDRLAEVQNKLRIAQEHEAAADRALAQSRESVRAAKAEIQALETEAREEARLAQEKMGAVGRIKREGERLGRHL